jgi:DnaJ-class molecular chaperone
MSLRDLIAECTPSCTLCHGFGTVNYSPMRPLESSDFSKDLEDGTAERNPIEVLKKTCPHCGGSGKEATAL